MVDASVMGNVTLSDCKSVLLKLGKNPDERIGRFDQDWEYTSARIEELVDYFTLYSRPDTTVGEKQILCCFMLQSLNQQVMNGQQPPLLDAILRQLFANRIMHRDELDYWMDTSDPDKKNWWPITETLLRYCPEDKE